MGKYIFRSKKTVIKKKGKSKIFHILEDSKFEKFDPTVLGLGNISKESKNIQAIAAVFDLNGFTNFCNQVDPHLCVPEYMNSFLNWLFYEVKEEFVKKSTSKGKILWAELPFFAKFTGDGVLFLWNTQGMNIVNICNVVISLDTICDDYKKVFLPRVKKDFVEPPSSLRCGIARGSVLSIGNDSDFVGSCINIASRLQKLGTLPFCISRRGFDFDIGMKKTEFNRYLLQTVSLRGIGDKELVWLRKSDYNKLLMKEKDMFAPP
jgi:hypothetical protein